MSRREDDDTASFEDVVAKAETDKALLCVIDDEEKWIPKSTIHDDSEVFHKDHEGKLVLQRWWASKEGLC